MAIACLCFNPRARVGRDRTAIVCCPLDLRVSIHAPAWGATFQPHNSPAVVVRGVSSHAPAWGATFPVAYFAPTYKLFQSTRPRGARHDVSAVVSLFQSFNLRARVGRDADWRRSTCWDNVCFNPRARLGRDQVSLPSTCRPLRFNPRARVGRDMPSTSSCASGRCFNPRARVGRDVVREQPQLCHRRVSIHAPAWGATHFMSAYHHVAFCFNPRARVGRDTSN